MGSSMKDIKLRIRSVESTRQITKAMQLVATSKIRRAKERMEGSRPYAGIAQESLSAIVASCKGNHVPFVTPHEGHRRCYVVITGDRGLAGGYNNNVYRAVAADAEGRDWCVLPVGRKAIEKYTHMKANVLSEEFYPVAGMPVPHCYRMAELLVKAYEAGEIDEVILASTTFVSMMTQEVVLNQLLPIEKAELTAEHPVSAIFEPSPEEVLEQVVPDFLAGKLYSAMCDACASENAARRNAMDSATKNADGMIGALRLKYNRARQGSITQEITEIVAGAEK